MYKLCLLILMILLFTMTASADVIAGPMIAMYIGVKFVIPLVLVVLLIIVTVRLIRTIRGKDRKED